MREAATDAIRKQSGIGEEKGLPGTFTLRSELKSTTIESFFSEDYRCVELAKDDE